MYKSILVILSFLFITWASSGQKVMNPKFDKKLESLLDHSVPEVSVADISNIIDEIVVLDAREYEEYSISHIPGARYFGDDDKQWDILNSIDKSRTIVVYCSVGYRSEKIARKIKTRGIDNVSNLYGSIFEWINCNLPVENIRGEATDSIHTYNKIWSKWVDNPQAIKTW